jgi:serine/threonine protein kinase/tetratricopeptide (TPR) repeat protein
MIGKTVSHYKILEKLGEGGMGIVYKAEDTRLKRLVALKFLAPSITTDEDANKRFIYEAQSASALDHPNICTIHEIDKSDDGQMFICMAYYDGISLREKIKRGPLTTEEAINIAIQIAQGLKQAHEKGITHRDIKPGNIIIKSDWTSKIIDFGLSKLASRQTITKSGTTQGTIAYMSPEQAQAKTTDHRVDIWALGVVLYEMLSAELPFKGEYDQVMLYSIVNEDPAPINTYRNDLPNNLCMIIDRMLDKNPEDRYQSIDNLLRDLHGILKEDQDSLSQIRPKSVKKIISKKIYWVLAGITSLLLILFFVFNNLFLGINSPSDTDIDQNSIAVMYFENRTEESDLDKILVDMLTTNLARYDELNVVSSQRLFDILIDIDRQDLKTIDKTVATEIANYAGVKTMMMGSIIQIGNNLRITSQLIDVITGNVIGSLHSDGEKLEDIFSMVDFVTEEVRKHLGMTSEATIPENFKISDVTTNSFLAYKLYHKGLEHQWQWEVDKAAEKFSQAITIDSTFSMAYLQLAISADFLKLASPFRDRTDVYKHLEKAERYSLISSVKERKFIQAMKSLFYHDFNKATSLFGFYVKEYPTEKDGYWFKGWSEYLFGDYFKAIQTLEILLAIDHRYVKGYPTLAHSYARTQQHEKAITTTQKYLALRPESFKAWHSAWQIYIIMGKFDEALDLCEKVLKGYPQWLTFLRYTGYTYLMMEKGNKAREYFIKFLNLDKRYTKSLNTQITIAFSYAYEGSFNKADREYNRSVKLAQKDKDISGEFRAIITRCKLQIARGDFSRALEFSEKAEKFASRSFNRSTIPWKILTIFYRGRAFAGKLEIKKAKEQLIIMQEYIEVSKLDIFYMDYVYMLEAEILILEKNIKQAQLVLDNVSSITKSNYPHFKTLLAECLYKIGKKEESIRLYEQLYNSIMDRYHSLGGDFFDFFSGRPLINYRLAKIYDQENDSEQAMRYYSNFLHSWRNADSYLPQLSDAKQRLIELQEQLNE